jgi:alpha-L-rhamnosidase
MQVTHFSTLIHRTGAAILICLFLTFLSAQLGWGGGVRVVDLRCEYAVDPMGTDVAQPRLSWRLESQQRGQRQTAYQVLVASSLARLRQNQGDLWDSGRVNADRSSHVLYAGPALPSRARAYWKVRVWDKNGRGSGYSPPAFWEMGLLMPADWQAGWIGLKTPWPGEEQWAQARWIWFPEGDPRIAAPAGRRYFRQRIVLPADRRIVQAQFRLAADDYFALFVNGQEAGCNVGKPYSWKFLNELDVTGLLVSGQNLFCILATNGPGSAGVLGQLTVEFEAGPSFFLQTDGSWKSSDQSQQGWQTPAFDDSAWPAVRELARPGEAPWETANYPPMGPCPYLRKAAQIARPIRQARLYVTALGVYEFYINGQRVGTDVFNPGWTDYARRVQYHTYDVTRLLRRGPNALGIILGDGWYAGFVGLGGRARYGTRPLASAQLEIELADGFRQTIVTDHSWKAATGPLRQSDMLMGETYDARLEMRGWNQPGFDDSTWQQVRVEEPGAHLVAAGDAPVRRTMDLEPRGLAEPCSGHFVFDLGQNMVGWVRLVVRGRAGTEVALRFAEMLNPDGTLYTNNLREAKCIDRYILKGGGKEVYEPHFTFHGFRYVELTGYPGRPDPSDVTGVVLHSDLPPAGRFECSAPLVNQLQSNITWGQRGNFLSIPTDCPQRDERLGWTGDAQVFVRTATCNMDVARFFSKWMIDVEDAQQADGAFTDVVPFVAARTGTAAWGDAGVICPWTIYQVYGDRRILERHYAAGARWIEYLQNNSTNLLRPAQGYGDWLSVGADTPKDVLATAYFAQSTRLLAKIAAVLGKTSDARKYEDLFQQIKSAFQGAYLAPDGRIQGDTQTCYALALAFDLLPAEKRSVAAQHLAQNVATKNGHLSTGFCGVGVLLPVLTQAGYLDTAYQLLNQDTFPSWLYSIKQGATTIWERWDGWTREHGFQTPWMNSFNHYSLGSVGAWLFETVAGIGLDPDQPAFKHIILRPRPGGGLAHARGEYLSPHGKIVSAWKIERGQFHLQVVVPPNTTATLYVPIAQPDQIREGNKPVAQVDGIEFLRREDGHCLFVLGSGKYQFSGPFRR